MPKVKGGKKYCKFLKRLGPKFRAQPPLTLSFKRNGVE